MTTQNPSLSKTLNPNFLSSFQSQSPSLSKFSNPFFKTLIIRPKTPQKHPKPLLLQSLGQTPKPQFSRQNGIHRGDFRSFAGRSNKKPGGPSTGRIEGPAELRREAKRNARKKSRKLAENLFYRLKNPHTNYPDNFSEDELQMIGLGYDRLVQFMEKDDPNLKHPFDWYKYGEFGPYSWRGVVLGEPIRGRFTDENVTLISQVRDHEEWEKIEQFEMAQDFGKRLKSLDKSVGFRYFWVFVRHPKWRISEHPWQQWTLVCEIVLEAEKKQRLDKWSLMGRLGNTVRSLITKCAAWMRPDIIYVKRPVYQCRFEPQDGFFTALTPMLDPETEEDCLYELENDDGEVELCTYFGGLCKIVKISQKAFVDDVVKAYDKLSDEKKSKCLEFLLMNHPIQLLHPYTKEWKAKLEEMELGCDAPDDDDYRGSNRGDTEVVDWIEDDGDDDDDDSDEDGDEDDDQDVVLDLEGGDDDEELGIKEEEEEDSKEEDEKYWEEEFKKAINSNEQMEVVAKRSASMSTARYKKQMKEMEEKEEREAEMSKKAAMKAMEMEREKESSGDGDEMAMRRTRARVKKEEWDYVGYGPYKRKIKKSRIPPDLFLRAAVRPFTYRNLVKEIVLTRHAILDGEIGRKK